MKKLACMIVAVGLMVTAPAAWAVDAIDGLLPTFRLVADDLDATYDDSNDVLLWADRVTAGGLTPIVLHNGPSQTDPDYNNVFPGADQTPHFQSGVMNGHDVVRFDDANYEFMSVKPPLGDTRDYLRDHIWCPGAASTVVVVFSKAADDITSNLFYAGVENDQTSCMKKFGIGQLYQFGWSGTATDGQFMTIDGTWGGVKYSTGYVVPSDETLWAMRESNGVDTQRLYMNGEQKGVDAGIGGQGLALNQPNMGICGFDHWKGDSWSAAGGDFLTGDIAEVIVFDKVLTALERQTVDNYILATYLPPAWTLGDMDGSGAVNNNDITPFVLALTNPEQYAIEYPLIDPDEVGDIDGDKSLTNNDITPFVALLTGGPQAVPEPATLTLLGVGGLALLRRGRKC